MEMKGKVCVSENCFENFTRAGDFARTVHQLFIVQKYRRLAIPPHLPTPALWRIARCYLPIPMLPVPANRFSHYSNFRVFGLKREQIPIQRSRLFESSLTARSRSDLSYYSAVSELSTLNSIHTH